MKRPPFAAWTLSLVLVLSLAVSIGCGGGDRPQAAEPTAEPAADDPRDNGAADTPERPAGEVPEGTAADQPAQPAATAERRRGLDNLRNLVIALHVFHDARDIFPPRVQTDDEGRPLFSWRVTLLPYLDQMPLYEQFRLDEPWDSEHNIRLLDRVPAVFRTVDLPPGMANIQAVAGEGTGFGETEGLEIGEFRDGMSNTILLVETSAENAVPWTKPDDFAWDPENPAAGLGAVHRETFLVVMGDGSVHSIPRTISAETLNALFTRAGDEAIDWSELRDESQAEF